LDGGLVFAPSGWAPPAVWAKTVFLLLPTASLAGAQAKDEEKRNERHRVQRTAGQLKPRTTDCTLGQLNILLFTTADHQVVTSQKIGFCFI